jgi:hypothetical protein
MKRGRIAANIAKLPGLKAAAFEKLAEQVAPNTRLWLPSTQFVLKPPSAGV